MFFQNIANWSKKLMWSVTIICYALYFGIIVIAPAITIFCKYNTTEGMKKITGLGLVLIVIIGIASYTFVKKAISKLPQVSVNEQRFKFGIETIFDCLPLGIALYAMFAVKDDIDLAFDTLKICLILFLVGILWNSLIIKFIDAEWAIRNGAKLDKEKAKRTGVV